MTSFVSTISVSHNRSYSLLRRTTEPSACVGRRPEETVRPFGRQICVTYDRLAQVKMASTTYARGTTKISKFRIPNDTMLKHRHGAGCLDKLID